MRTGIANLPLHGGKAPRWLFGRMVKLAEGIVGIMLEERDLMRMLGEDYHRYREQTPMLVPRPWHRGWSSEPERQQTTQT